MFLNTDAYITKCKSIGILTEDAIRKYPLRSANLALVLKAYAVDTNKPYTIDVTQFDLLNDYTLYLTEGGLEWLYDFFARHSLAYLKSAFQFLFLNATEADVLNPEGYAAFNNFRGTVGLKPKAGTKQRALLVRAYGKNGILKEKREFDTIVEARDEFFNLSRFFPADSFTLYRLRTQIKNGKTTSFKEKIPLYLEPNKRGLHLSNVRDTNDIN